MLSRKKLYITMLMVLVISLFIMNVPQNMYNTISARSFITCVGIGEYDMSIGISQTQTLTSNVAEVTAEIASTLEGDADVSEYTVLFCKMFNMIADDGSIQHFRVEPGDHDVFPITYSKGRSPQTETEIAISVLNVGELEKTAGDQITLIIDGVEKRLTVCGIYSDITNGGKTSKAVFEANQGEILWSSIPVTFNDRQSTEKKVAEYRRLFPFAKVSSIETHMGQMFGSTIAAVRIASYASIAAAVALTILVTLLFMKMLVTKDRYFVAILKSTGFTYADIRRQYVTRYVVVLAIGVIIGTVLSNTVGEFAGVALISSFGASSFNFVINPLFAYLFSPILIALCVYAATLLGTADISSLKISEHIKEA